MEIEGSAPEDDQCWILSENWDVVRAFLAAQTQWRVGAAGFTGLDYRAARVAVRSVFADGHGLRKRGKRLSWRDVFAGLRVLEGAVLRLSAKTSKRR